MKTTFHIANKEFADYLKITAGGNEYYFCDDVTIEYEDCNQLDFEIEFVRAEDYSKHKIKNPVLRFLAKFLQIVLSPLLFFFDNENGIRLDKGFHSFNPFTLKKAFSISQPDGKTVILEFSEAKYDRFAKVFSKPNLIAESDSVQTTNEEIKYSANILKKEWNLYHIPAYTVIMIFILLLNWLNFSIFAKVIGEIPLYSMWENIGGVIGMSFCSLVMIALLVAYTVIISKTYKLYKRVNQNQTK